MRYLRGVVVGAAAIAIFAQGAVVAQEWVVKDRNIINADSRGMLIERGTYFLATRDALYATRDAAEGWKSVFALPKGASEISCVDGRGRNIYVGTGKGLYRSQDFGRSWGSACRTFNADKNRVNCVSVSRVDPGKVVIGTDRGVFMSMDSGKRWTDMSANLKMRVRCLALDNGTIFAGGYNGLYSREGESRPWNRLYVVTSGESTGEDNTEEPVEDGDEEPDEERAINGIAIRGGRLYIAVGEKVLCSDDSGRSWNALPPDGISGKVRFILAAGQADKIYAATEKGVFESDGASGWRELYTGMKKRPVVNSLMFEEGSDNNIWAMTEKGLYRLEGGRYMIEQRPDVERNPLMLKMILGKEPPFGLLQAAAIKHAEVSPEKISAWRTQARLKALVPTVSLGVDKARSNTYEIYTSATKDYVIGGPDDVNEGWDISVSWDLADLVWSTDQTSIDVRSKLMVQLRNDILDDLRRAYFERRRVQYELVAMPPEDPKARFEKELRLAELTQAIDDLTDNSLSEYLSRMEKRQAP